MGGGVFTVTVKTYMLFWGAVLTVGMAPIYVLLWLIWRAVK